MREKTVEFSAFTWSRASDLYPRFNEIAFILFMTQGICWKFVVLGIISNFNNVIYVLYLSKNLMLI